MKKFSQYKGFTLVELMIVIAIIGILAAVLYPSLTGYLEKTRDTKRQSDVRAISQAVSQYYSDRNTFPGKIDTVCPDEIKDEIANANANTGSQYMKSLPKDDKMKVITTGTTCTSGYGYKWIKKDATTTADGQSSIVSASMENKANASMLRATYEKTDLHAVEAVAMTPKSDASNTELYTNEPGKSSTRGNWILTQTQE